MSRVVAGKCGIVKVVAVFLADARFSVLTTILATLAFCLEMANWRVDLRVEVVEDLALIPC